MSNQNKIDSFFNQTAKTKRNKKSVSEKLRLILPIFAILLMALLILFPTIKEDVRSFAFEITKPQEGELEKLVVENLNYYITDKDNLVHNFKATHIQEIDTQKKITKLSNLEAIYNQGNNWFDIKSNVGYFHQNQNILKMPNKVDIFYSQGFELNTTNVINDFNKKILYSKKPIKGNGFLGKVNADSFEYNTKTEVLTFIGNVKIIKSEEQ